MTDPDLKRVRLYGSKGHLGKCPFHKLDLIVIDWLIFSLLWNTEYDNAKCYMVGGRMK